MTKQDVTLHLTHDQALVLFEWLWGKSDNKSIPIAHEAERSVLWDIEAQLEKILVEPFQPNYASLVDAARARLVPGSE
jgi:hypothetical protein